MSRFLSETVSNHDLDRCMLTLTIPEQDFGSSNLKPFGADLPLPCPLCDYRRVCMHLLCGECRGFETQWDVGFDQYETISRQVPTMVAEGNHETDWPGRRPIGASDRFANTATDSGVHVIL